MKKLLFLFNKLIDEDKIYLNPALSLAHIAVLLNSNRTYISRIINEEYRCNFYDFINGKRIEYAKALVVANPRFVQEQISRMSGFNHATSFSRIFKKQMGITFKEWRNGIR